MDARRKRLIYRSNHCGMKENDVMIGRFAVDRVENMTEGELDMLENLMNHTDNDLYNWITGKEPTPDMVDCDVLQQIKKYNGTL